MATKLQKLKAIKAISKCCFFCSMPIRFWHLTIGCCGPFDYVRAHRKCAKRNNLERMEKK